MTKLRDQSQRGRPDLSRNRDSQTKLHPLIAGISLPAIAPRTESSFSTAYDGVYDCGIRDGQSKAQEDIYAAYTNSCVDLRSTLSSLLEKVGLDAGNQCALRAAAQRRGKDYSVDRKIAGDALAALTALEHGQNHASAAEWAAAFEQLVLAGRHLGKIDEMSRERTAIIFQELFAARERWRRDKSRKHERFNSATAFEYGNGNISLLNTRRVQNLIIQFKRSCFASRNLLLAPRPEGAFYDPHRGEPKRPVKPKNTRNHSGK